MTPQQFLMTAPVADSPATKHAEPVSQSFETAEERRKKFRERLVENQKDRKVRLKAFLLDLRKKLRDRDWDAHCKHWQDTDMMLRYYVGNHYGGYDSGIYQPLTRQPGDFAYAIPVMNGHVDHAVMMLLRTRIEYECTANDQNNPEDKGVAKMCEKLGTREYHRLLDEDARYTEILNSIMAGESYRCVLWAIDPVRPRTVERPQYQAEEVQTPGHKECAACGAILPEDQQPPCPKCGATFLKDLPGGSFTRQNQTGMQTIPLAQNILHIPHVLSIQSDLSASKLQYATYLIERDYLPSKEVAEWMYQTTIEPGQEGLSESTELRRTQERRSVQTDAIAASSDEGSIYTGGGIGGRRFGGGGAITPAVEREQIWVEPSEYGRFYLSEEEQLPDSYTHPITGEVIKSLPADNFLGDVWEEGMTYCVVGNTVVKCEPDAKNDRWVKLLYGKRPGTSRGAGMQTLIPLNDIVDDTFNVDYAILMSSMPLRVAVRKYIQEFPGPENFLFLDQLPGNVGIEQAVRQYPAQTPSGAVGATAARTEEWMQFIAGTFSPGGAIGAPDAKAAGTATGIAAMQESAAGRMEPMITQRVYADKEFMTLCLQNIQKFSSPEQIKELEKEFGPDTVRRFREVNLRHAISWTVSGNTAQPRSTALTQAKLVNFSQMAAALGKSKVPWAMSLLTEMADLMDLPMKIVAGREDTREAEYRLNKLAAIEHELVEKKPDLLMNSEEAARQMFDLLERFVGPLSLKGAQEAAKAAGAESVDGLLPFLFLQDHDAFMAACKDWLFGEEAKTASEARKLAVMNIWMEHFKAQQMTQVVMAQFQQEMMQQFAPQQGEDKGAEIKAKGEQEAQRQKAAHDAQAGKAILEHKLDEEKANAQLQRDLIKEGHKAETQMVVDKARENGRKYSAYKGM